MRLRYNQCDVNTVVGERTPPTQAGIAYVDVYWSVWYFGLLSWTACVTYPLPYPLT